MTNPKSHAIDGAGIGLRAEHVSDILEGRPDIPWFEALTENYIGAGGLPLYHLEQVRASYPITLHGVGMSLGSTDPLNETYLSRLRRLMQRIEPEWISDHLAWISVGGHHTHDLIPLPYTRESLTHIASRIEYVQESLHRRILLENPSSYLSFVSSDIPEWEFLNELTRRTGCGVLLDVNNVYVSATNQGIDPTAYLDGLNLEHVSEIHLAGYEEYAGFLFDTHGLRVHEPVWALYQATLARIGPTPTLIEWDSNIPELGVLREEAATAQQLLDAAA